LTREANDLKEEYIITPKKTIFLLRYVKTMDLLLMQCVAPLEL